MSATVKKKKCKVIIALTNNASPIYKLLEKDTLHPGENIEWNDDPRIKNVHIHVLSDDTIGDDDWFMSAYHSYPLQNKKELRERDGGFGWTQEELNKSFKGHKVIATTDIDICSASPSVLALSEEFAEDYMIRYNDWNAVTEVVVVYTDGNPTEVFIQKIKQNFNREELRPILLKLVHDVIDVMEREDTTGFELDPWMEDNL